jgi:hypothetical protein
VVLPFLFMTKEKHEKECRDYGAVLISTGIAAQVLPDVYHGPSGLPSGVEVNVSRPTPLSVVIAVLCRAKGAKCVGLQTAASQLVAPIVLAGTLESVLSGLLRGTNINYVSIESGKPGFPLVLQLRDKPVATSEPPANDALLVPDLRPEMGAESSENASTELSTRVPWQSTAAEGSHEWDGATVSWRAAGLANTEGPFSWKRGITQDSGPLHDGTISEDGPPLPVPSGIAFPGRPGLPLFGPLPDARGRPIPLHPSPGGAPFPH